MTAPTLTVPRTSAAAGGPRVLARGTVARGAGGRTICPECGADAVIGEACPGCRSFVAPEGVAGTLTVATVVAGRRVVVTAERTPEGRWCPGRLGHPRLATVPRQD
jgi:hypothetical protein